MRLFTNATLATLVPGRGAYGLISPGAVLIEGDRIAWAGPSDAPPGAFRGAFPEAVSHAGRGALPKDLAEDLGGALVTPGLIDCHTHLIHGGDRAREFEMRLKGASYEEVARAGGGIVSTVAATRAATEDELIADALPRLDAMIAEGVCTVEVKSGYGLDIETELRMLRAARALSRVRDVAVVTTFLGAHAVPPEFAGRPGDYLSEVCLPALEAAAQEGLVDAVDGFCERIAFSAGDMARVFDRAHALGLPVKLHAEQLSHGGGTALAARHGALSADHVEYATAADAAALAAAGSVAVLLPGAFYTLRETQVPPVEAFRAAGVEMAVATDFNPGSSPMQSLLLAMNMAATLFRLTPEESLAGATRVAAKALGLRDRGMIAAGMRADLAVWDAAHPAELSYRIGVNRLVRRIRGGVG